MDSPARPLPRALIGKPFRQLRNPFPPQAVLSDEDVAKIEAAAYHILENLGVDFWHGDALRCFDEAGADVDYARQHVRLDRGLVQQALATAPSIFTLTARNPAHNLTVGEGYINFVPVAGAPYYSAQDTPRRTATLADFQRLLRLAQVATPIHWIDSLLVEPQDVPDELRSVVRAYWHLLLSDKVFNAVAAGAQSTRDYIEMASIVFGGHDALAAQPVMAGIINANSPLRYDGPMIEGLMTLASHGQAVIVTPYTTAGAMAPVTLAGALAQSVAEALAGLTLAQLVRPGTPTILGGATIDIDMATGIPAMGSPHAAIAILAYTQLTRHFGLPSRAHGGLTNSNIADAQAAWETQWTLWPTVMAHANVIIHAAGWLESGLTCSLEKFVFDLEGLAMMHEFLKPLIVDDDTLALDSIAEVGPGGHHFATAHTLSHFRHALYRPLLADRGDYETFLENGSKDARARAFDLAQQLLAAYEQPAIDPAIHAAMIAHATQRGAGEWLAVPG